MKKKKITLPVQADVSVQLSQAMSLPPNTTLEQDKVVAGQRGISLMWETTQMRIALWVVIGGFIVNAAVVVIMLIVIITKLMNEVTVTTLEFALLMTALGGLTQTSGIVIGFYFSRTNHAAIGGIGEKATDNPPPYVGR